MNQKDRRMSSLVKINLVTKWYRRRNKIIIISSINMIIRMSWISRINIQIYINSHWVRFQWISQIMIIISCKSSVKMNQIIECSQVLHRMRLINSRCIRWLLINSRCIRWLLINSRCIRWLMNKYNHHQYRRSNNSDLIRDRNIINHNRTRRMIKRVNMNRKGYMIFRLFRNWEININRK